MNVSYRERKIRGAKLVRRLELWPWSSYRATCGQAAVAEWFQVDYLLLQFASQRARAIAKYVAVAHEGARLPSVCSQLQRQVYLGSEAFASKMQALVDNKPALTEIPRAQRRALARSLAKYAAAHPRNVAIALAYLSGQHTMVSIAQHFDVHYTTVSR